MQPPAAMGELTTKQSSRNAEDEACARELLVLGNRRTSANDSSSRKVSIANKNNRITKNKLHQPSPNHSPAPIAIILDDHQDMAINGHEDVVSGDDVVDDTFTFITSDVNDNADDGFFNSTVDKTPNLVRLGLHS